MVLNPSDYQEHSRRRGKEESCDVAGGDGETGPFDDLAEVVGSRDVLEEAPSRDRVRLDLGDYSESGIDIRQHFWGIQMYHLTLYPNYLRK